MAVIAFAIGDTVTDVTVANTMSLFDKLVPLCRKDKFRIEDFHTEIVAQVLRDCPKLTLHWLRTIEAIRLGGDPHEIRIVTQESFPALINQDTDSRPDIAIRLGAGDEMQLVLIESKVKAKEGPDQLTRYAEQLSVRNDRVKPALVFITRDFCSPQHARFSRFKDSILFLQERWSDFYKRLAAHANGDGLAAQLKLFMQENNMSERNLFTAVDIVALENFLAAKQIIDATLFTDVAKRLSTIAGRVNTPRKAISSLSDDRNYCLHTGFGGKQEYFDCYLGYWLPKGPGERFTLGMDVGGASARVISALRDFAKRSNGSWVPHELESGTKWGWISNAKYLQEFLSETDHVQAIKDFFHRTLKDLETFKKAHPELP